MNNSMNICWNIFKSSDELATKLAGRVAKALCEAIRLRGNATLAVSGGKTPTRFLEKLSEEYLEWSKVFITLVDERCVPATSDRSNARLIRNTLLQKKAREASFFPLFLEACDTQEAAKRAENTLRSIPMPPDVAVLGMGVDGHTASLFPDAFELSKLLDRNSPLLVSAVQADSAGETRLTMTLSLLSRIPDLILHIEGDSKKNILQDAVSSYSHLPIRQIIDAAHSPVQIFWAPEEPVFTSENIKGSQKENGLQL